MEDIHPKLTVGDVVGYVLAYLCWLCTAAAGLLAIMQLRSGLNVIWIAWGGSKWTLRAADRFGLVLAGLVWLVYVIFVEQHYRSAITLVRVRRLKRRTGELTKPEYVPDSRFIKWLHKLGLDVLAMRFIITLTLPLILFAVAYLTIELGFRDLS